MKVNILIPNLTRSAPIINAIEIANAISNKYDVHIFSLSKSTNHLVFKKININIKVTKIGIPLFFSKIIYLNNILFKQGGRKNNITFSFTIQPDITLSYVKKNSIVISSIRGNLKTNYKYSFGFFSSLVRRLHFHHLSKFDKILCISEDMYFKLKLDFKNLLFIGNFIDEIYYENFRSTNSKKSDKIIFLFLGRFVKLKNIEQIIKIAIKLKSKKNKISFYLVGDGPLKIRIKNLITNHKLEDIVLIFNETNEIHKFINQSDYLILPSLSEGVSRSILESLFFGTPIISNNTDSSNELIEHNKNGFIYDSEDSFLKIIENIISKKNFILKKNYSLIPEKFKYDTNVKKYLDLISSYNNKI